MAGKDSFILYTEQKAVIDKLSNEQAGKLIKAIYEYVETGKMPELDITLDLVITPFKTILDKNKAKYEEVSKARAEAGSKGGKQNKQKEANKSKIKQKKQLQTKDSNCDDNDNDNENDNDLEKENIKKKYGENGNVKFTDDEFEKVKSYFPNDYMDRIQSLDDYMQSTGKKYKDFFATLKNWARKDGYKPPSVSEPKKEEKFLEVDTSQLTQEEYGKLMRQEITMQELIEKGRVNVG